MAGTSSPHGLHMEGNEFGLVVEKDGVTAGVGSFHQAKAH
jgi:hypothetical protein